jgi:hypothetical protein
MARHVAPPPTPSFRTEQADFFFPFCSCKTVGLRRETSAPSRTVHVRDEISLFRDFSG